MELRLLHYFLTIAQEESILKASKKLNITQPTLSRQIKDFEDQLGYPLFVRGNRKILLTEEGLILKKRAEEILELVHKTEEELSNVKDNLSGHIYIGGGETEGMIYILKAIKRMQSQYPLVRFHLYSGDKEDIIDKLDKGILDFGLLVSFNQKHKYEVLDLPYQDRWGLLVRKDDPLATKDYLINKDIENLPLIISRQDSSISIISEWLKKDMNTCNIVATYNLIYNASLMVKEGIGYTVCLDRLANTSKESELTFIPFYPTLSSSLSLVWKKQDVLNHATKKFLQMVEACINDK